MSKIEKSIEVNVPVRTAYNQWTQFEDFPRFMEGVREVRQLDDRRLMWRAEIAGKEKSWQAEISEQIPDARVAWHSTSGAHNAGVVTFHKLDDQHSKIMVQIDFVPEGIKEKVGSAINAPDRQVKGDLERFKELVETKGGPTDGGWRGEVPREG